jgi:pyridoxamine 5'-phosphate oxidase
MSVWILNVLGKKMSIAHLRTEYKQAALLENDALPCPVDFFAHWFNAAVAAQVHEPNAMTLATVSTQLRPSARIVLLKGFNKQGFVFFTNYQSRKGQELAHNPYASLLFFWPELERQVRIEGKVEQSTAEDSDAYYASRPAGSRLGAWASPQSQIVGSRLMLEQTVEAAQQQHGQEPQSRPPFWGGYRLIPHCFEFWQGRPSRLHDRLVYQHDEGQAGWQIVRLAP